MAGGDYSLENAVTFSWASVSGRLSEERLGYLQRYVTEGRILDAGCGGGAYVDHLSHQGLQATGVDKHVEFLAVARERQFAGTFVRSDLNLGLPFADKSFDCSICFDVLEHLDDRHALRELARVTKRRLLVTVPQADARQRHWLLTYYPYVDLTHLRYYTAESLHETLATTVAPVQVNIFEAGRVPIEALVYNLFTARSKYPLLSPIYQKLFQFLVGRSKGPDWYIGLAAVVDLAPQSESD